MTFPFVIGASQQKRSGRPFIIKVNYASGFTVTLPLYNAGGYNYNFIVDWGDGAVSQVISATDANRIHTYASGGTYTITMTGILEGWTGNTAGLKEYIVEVTQWGRTGFKSVSMGSCARLISCYGKLITSQTSFGNLFSYCSALISCDVSNWDVSSITDFTSMFRSCTSLTSLNTASWSFNTTSNVGFSYVFNSCSSLTSIGDTSSWNTSKFVTLQLTFTSCSKLSSLDVSGWDLGNCTNLSSTFQNCSSLTSLDVSSWNVSKITNFGNMLASCSGLTSLNTASWTFNTTTAVNFGGVFGSCTNLTTVGDTSSWNTSKFTTLSNTWDGCSKLASLNVGGWNLSSLTILQSTFRGCVLITILDTSSWDTSAITNCSYAFNNCKALTSSFTDSKWWNRSPGIGTYTQCFRGATNISNYSSIPTSWK